MLLGRHPGVKVRTMRSLLRATSDKVDITAKKHYDLLSNMWLFAGGSWRVVACLLLGAWSLECLVLGW